MHDTAFVGSVGAAAGLALRHVSTAFSSAKPTRAPASARSRCTAHPSLVSRPPCDIGGGPISWNPWRGGGGGSGDGGNKPLPLPLASRLACANSFGAAFFGWGISSLLVDRSSSSGDLTKDDLREAAHVGLLGLILHGIVGTMVYSLLDDSVSGSTPIPVAIKTCIDALVFLPFLATAHDAYCDYVRAGKAGRFMQSIRSHDQSAAEILRRRVIWVPAQAVSFLLLPAWWRVGYTSFIMAALAVFRAISGSDARVAPVNA